MNKRSDASKQSVTILQWLDAAARGQTPLPASPTIAKALRFLGVLRLILTWSLTLLMLQVVGLGLLFTSASYASGGYAALFGFYVWMLTGALVALLGTLALVSRGRFVGSVVYLVFSPVASFGFMLGHFGMSTISPLLVIPPALVLNCAYFYVAWRYMLSPRLDGHDASASRLA
ncbi:MAG TPA: hypothetical protein VGR43_11400 [Dehalococcoidia bacterium]|nr:hypothetical protein [Dehalococcoidia bacterium]